jgi:phosphonate transport system substrate-binding protein
MKHASRNLIPLLALLLSFTSATVTASHDPTASKQFNFGVVPQFEQRKLFRIWRPILDELEKRTGFAFHLVGSSKIPVFEKKYMEGVFDFAYMNPYHILKANDSQGYVPLIRDGGRVLKGVLVVRENSPIKQVSELAGKQVAFPAPNALGASLLIRADLAKLHNLDIIPLYVQTHSSVYLHVATGMTEAGGGVASTLHAQKPTVQKRLRVLYETRTMNPHPVSAHPRVIAEDREKVRQALLDMAATEQGKALLSKVPIKRAVTATMDDYAPMLDWGLDEFYVNE